ncbi:MAG TPA: AraC family transcriptional regulator [Candidatus Angelobacter sp.]
MLQDVVIDIHSLSQISPSVAAEQDADPRLLLALHFIANNHSQASLGLKDVSKSAGLSAWYFSRLFNTSMRMGLREYLKNVRLEHACRLLKSSSLSIKEIAASVGYNHLSDFYHHFKSGHGISPLVFRRQARRTSTLLEDLSAPRTMQQLPRQ